MLGSLTVRCAGAAARAWPIVLVLALAASAGSLWAVRAHLGINTDTADMISPSLDWRQRYLDFKGQFPHFSDTLAVVVDADTPDLAAAASTRLAAALAERGDVFRWVEQPGDRPFLRRHALLLLDAEERTALARDLVAAQPLLGRLHRDPSLAAVLDLLADALQADVDLPRDTVGRFADRFADAIDAVLDGRFHRLSWRRVMLGDAGDGARQVIVAAPVLDYNQLFPAEDAIAVVRATARALDLEPARGVHVRITGGLAMSDEELRSVSTGASRAAVLALAGVAVVLALGLGSVRLVLATLVTLLAGLLWTAAFAAAAVGNLNMISVAFAVLYIGLGVDYAVHYGLRYRELLMHGLDHAAAIEHAAGDVGVSIALCALTTGAGFLAFLPTSFAGVSELGLIAGVGMFVSLVATLTLMPALLTLMRPRRGGMGRLGVHLPGAQVLDRLGRARPRTVAVSAAAVAAMAAVLAGGARFDDNPLNLRDPGGEAVSTYRDLVAEGRSWTLDVLVADAAEARRAATALERLPEVARVVSLASFVPRDQDTALAQVEELALLLGPDLVGAPGTPSPPGAARAALERLVARLEGTPPADTGLAHLATALARLQDALDAAAPGTTEALLARLQTAVTATLPGELARLGEALDAGPVAVADLPAALVRDWRAPDGRLRLEVEPEADLNDPRALTSFVEAVRGAAPGAVGTPVIHLESGRVVVRAFAEAFALALVCITAILYLVLRRVTHVAAVLAPLLLGALVSVAVLVALDLPFNFANVIALPLLLGVGVDSGIHMLFRARINRAGEALAGSSTARGVLTSALTTTVSFGNLAFSTHPGTASMGVLLTIGMLAMLASTLLVLPALVTLLPAPGGPRADP